MKKLSQHILDLPLHERALLALQAAVKNAMEENAREGFPVYIWEDGKVVEVSPEELRKLYPGWDRLRR